MSDEKVTATKEDERIITKKEEEQLNNLLMNMPMEVEKKHRWALEFEEMEGVLLDMRKYVITEVIPSLNKALGSPYDVAAARSACNVIENLDVLLGVNGKRRELMAEELHGQRVVTDLMRKKLERDNSWKRKLK